MVMGTNIEKVKKRMKVYSVMIGMNLLLCVGSHSLKSEVKPLAVSFSVQVRPDNKDADLVMMVN